MSLEAMDAIALAEEKARQIKAAAVLDAKKTTQDAREAGQLAVTAAEAKAESEIRELMKKADDKAKEDAAVLASSTRNRKAAMKARAERKTDEAVALILRSVMGG